VEIFVDISFLYGIKWNQIVATIPQWKQNHNYKEHEMGEQMTRKEAATLLGVNPGWLAKGALKLNASKDLPFIKYGKRVVRYERTDVEAFKQRHKMGQDAA
jgi:hypothetical protein